MKFEHTEVVGFDSAFRGMRNPKDSWHLGDSFCVRDLYGGSEFVIGSADMKLAQSLIRAGAEHRKFLRYIDVYVDITAPLYWWSEYDAYKVGTVANSCSTMHKLHAYPICLNMFAVDHAEWDEEDIAFWKHLVSYLENKRRHYNSLKSENHPNSLVEFRKLKQALSSSFEQKRTVKMSYENLLAMCSKGQRRHHRLKEWHEDFISWAMSLPYAQELIFIDKI